MQVRHFVLAVPLFSLFVSPAAGQNRHQEEGARPAEREARFREWDSNGDGSLQKAEFRGHPGNFNSLDTNHDRLLSRDEFVHRGGGAGQDPGHPPPAPPATDMFGGIDSNNDSRVTAQEWQRSPLNLPPVDFEVYDANNDNYLVRDEFKLIVDRSSRPTRFADRDLNNDGMLTRSEWPNDEPVSFDRTDRDDNGRVSWREYQTPTSADSREAKFGELDRNDDGVLSRAETRSQPVVFARLDRNGDGVVTMREFLSQPAANAGEAAFDQQDVNDNGVIDRNEWSATAAVDFDRADRNNDGGVTFREFTNLPPAEYRDARFEEMDDNNDGVLARREWSADRGTFDRLDRNNDNVVTYREYGNPPTASNRQARFDEMDRNNNRAITRQEWTGDWESFNILDQNNDDILTVYEFNSTGGLSTRFRYLDRNRDGWLAREEWPENRSAFDRLDKNRDGRLTTDEFMM